MDTEHQAPPQSLGHARHLRITLSKIRAPEAAKAIEGLLK